MSTDKAVAPQNLYGATKLCSDRLFLTANDIKGNRPIKFSVVRYGNVMGSRGSVIPIFLKQRKSGIIKITSKEMTRFNVLMNEAIDTVIWTIKNSLGGEVVIPKAPSYNILNLADAIAPNCSKKIIGIRPGEKIHEELISKNDSLYTYELKDKFIILHNMKNEKINFYKKKFKAKKVKKDFVYNSGSNSKFLTTENIKNLVSNKLD